MAILEQESLVMSRVARYHADRTNQKLYFARLACQQAEQTDHVQQVQAYREAAVFHLHGAMLAFLQELVRYYRLNDLQPTLKSIEEHIGGKRTSFSGSFCFAAIGKRWLRCRIKTCLPYVPICTGTN